MKKCPACSALCKDDELRCGVCGSSLIDVPDKSLEQTRAQQLSNPAIRRVHRNGFFALTFGSVLVVLGILLIMFLL